MIIETTVELPDGRAFGLSLEPRFDRSGHRVVNFVVHAIEEKPKHQTELVTAEGSFWFDRQ